MIEAIIGCVFLLLGGLHFLLFGYTAAKDFMVIPSHRDTPTAFRDRLVKSDVLRGLSDAGIALYGIVLILFGMVPVAPWTLLTNLFVWAVAIYNLVVSLLNYVFLKTNNISHSLECIKEDWQREHRISIFHDYEETYYNTMKNTERKQFDTLMIAVLLLVVLLFLL